MNASPRPLLLVGGDEQTATSEEWGFDGNSDAKLAFMDGMVDPPSSFPAGPQVEDGFTPLTVAQAFAELTAHPGRGATPPPGTQVHTTAVALGSAGFDTDRGLRQLPAWGFTFDAATGSLDVLAVAPASIYPDPAPLSAPSGVKSPGDVRLGPDGRTLVVDTAGAPPGTGPCDARYSLQSAASSTAVAIAVDVQPNPIPSNVGCPLVAVGVQLTVVLATPLGARVLIDVRAQPVEVTEVGPAP